MSEDERETLVRWSRRSTSAQNLAQRCRIVLGCADGKTNQEVAAELGIWPQTVGKWRRRFNRRRLEGLVDEPRPGAPRTIEDEQIEAVVVATLERTPKNATHWSRASMAAESGLSESTVGRIWKAFNLKPHQVDTFNLFDVGADLSTPVKASENGGAAADGDGKQDAITPLRITQDYVDRLERDCDEYNAVLTKLRSFILPGGTPVAAQLHMARTVARRAERSTWSALDEHGDGVNPLTVKYLNRLSDLLFILSRVASTDSHGGTGDILWVPGGEHGERDFPKVTVPPLDPDNRKKEW